MGKCTGHYFYAVAACASMKAPPKREGKSPSQYRLQRASTSLNEGSYKIVGKSATSPMFAPPSTGLYESPSRKEGKYCTCRKDPVLPPSLNESPSQKEGKSAPPSHTLLSLMQHASMKAPPTWKGIPVLAVIGEIAVASMKVPTKL